MTPDDTLPVDYFLNVYNNNEDPWNFVTSDYEQQKFQATVEVLTKPVYNNAFEIGCSIGVLTEKLAPRCERLLAVDVTPAPIANARKRLQDHSNVRFEQMVLPHDFPADIFDLIIMSEVGYYFSMPDLEKTKGLILQHLSSGGQLLMVHWTPIVHDYPLTGDQVHEAFLKDSGEGKPFKVLYSKREEKYRINLLEKAVSDH